MACQIPKYSEKYRPCIYQIRNIENDKVYIGSTFRFNRRKRLHLYRLNHNCHKNIHLQRAWNKYGKEKFIFEILEDVDLGQNFNRKEAKLILCSKEQLYIDKLLPEDNNYNIRKLADSNLGSKIKPMTEECKRKIGRANRRFNDEQIREMFNLSSKGFTNQYISNLFKLDSSQVSRILNGRRMYNEYINNSPPININIKPNKLDKNAMIEIYRRSNKGESCRDLALEYLVDPSTISRIKTRKRNYSWLPVE